MVSTGIVREIDDLGRIVLPVELRRLLEIEIGDRMEYFIDEASGIIMTRKYVAQECLFCKNPENLYYFKQRFVCGNCMESMNEAEDFFMDDYYGEAPSTGFKQKSRAEASPLVQVPSHAASGDDRDALKQPRSRRKDTLERLQAAMEQNPGASQKELAAMVGVSQARVSQLIKQFRRGGEAI